MDPRGSWSFSTVHILSRNLVDSSTEKRKGPGPKTGPFARVSKLHFFRIPRFLPVEGEEGSNPFPRGMSNACKDFFASLVILDLVEVFCFSFNDVVDSSSFFDHIHEDLVGDDSSE